MVPAITVHLVDSAYGHPLQTWTFADHDSVTMGRSPENDIVLADPYVSRSHAYLKFDGDEWRLIAISRHQIVYQGQTLAEMPVDDGMVCRLGPRGCYLRFVRSDALHHQSATIMPDTAVLPIFKLDRVKLQQEVGQIVDLPFFQQLKNTVRQRREQRPAE